MLKTAFDAERVVWGGYLTLKLTPERMATGLCWILTVLKLRY